MYLLHFHHFKTEFCLIFECLTKKRSQYVLTAINQKCMCIYFYCHLCRETQSESSKSAHIVCSNPRTSVMRIIMGVVLNTAVCVPPSAYANHQFFSALIFLPPSKKKNKDPYNLHIKSHEIIFSVRFCFTCILFFCSHRWKHWYYTAFSTKLITFIIVCNEWETKKKIGDDEPYKAKRFAAVRGTVSIFSVRMLCRLLAGNLYVWLYGISVCVCSFDRDAGESSTLQDARCEHYGKLLWRCVIWYSTYKTHGESKERKKESFSLRITRFLISRSMHK